MYAVFVTYSAKTEDGRERSLMSPTFYLDERTQGIIDEDHARKIVSRWQADVLDPDVDYKIHVVHV